MSDPSSEIQEKENDFKKNKFQMKRNEGKEVATKKKSTRKD